MPRPFLAVSALGGAALVSFGAGCSRRAPSPAVSPTEASAPELDADGAAPPTAADRPPIDGLDAAVGDAGVDAAAGDAAATDAAVGDAGALATPQVKVVTIGMHVGGGPYDEATKEPIRRSVEPRFSELAACFRHVAEPARTDVGVDLLIEASGGRARVSNPRTTMKNEDFVACVVRFFESVEFRKPLHGRTVVSYSVRFVP